jgi:hypothetical protein
MMRIILALVMAVWSTTVIAGTSGRFEQLPIGGGGFVTGVQMYPNGMQLARTDTAGGYIRTSPTAKWKLINTRQSMPSTDNAQGMMNGVCEIVAAPSNTSILYMYFAPNLGLANNPSYIYVSTNKGANWSRTSFASSIYCNANGGAARLVYPTMGVSPKNASVVYVGTARHGIYYTTNGGKNWTQVPAIPPSGGGNPNLVHRFLGSNHIRRPVLAYRTKCGRRGGG